MQKRHNNRADYFKELSITSRDYLIPYIQLWYAVEAGMDVLEIGCGEGGNLLPFAELGCNVTGVDISEGRIEEARSFFNSVRAKGTFIAQDFFKMKGLEGSFNLIICHDVFEHITDKAKFLSDLGKCLKPAGIVFMAFPAWQMPFGGHQQICRSGLLSHLPFFHLLPVSLYRLLLKAFGENESCIKELLSIKRTRVTIEQFERLLRQTNFFIQNRQLWFINPHYKTKFGLSPRKLPTALSSMPYLRNFFTTSCFYILRLT